MGRIIRNLSAKHAKRIIVLFMTIIFILLLTGCSDEKTSTPDRVILDCDMGVMNDDALALSMLLQGESHGNFKVIGITLEGGNFFIDASFETDGVLQTGEWNNTNQFLESVGRTDIPVYKGTDYPTGFTGESISDLVSYYKNADYLPFNDGYGAIHAFDNVINGTLCSSDAASDFMVESVREYPGNVVIIAIGPTMNIAKAIEKDPSFAENVKAVYYMGGALGDCYEAETTTGKKVFAVKGANVTPYAEYNALYDPNALFKCLTAGFPKQYIAPAELSIEYDESVAARLKTAKGDNAVVDRWCKEYGNSVPGYPYWDPIAAFGYLYPECIVNAEERYITVNTDRNDDRFGETTAICPDEYKALSENEKSMYGKATVINEVESFWDKTIELLTTPKVFTDK